MKSYKVEVQVAGEQGWHSNAVRYASEEDAKEAGASLFARWTLTTDWRVVPSEDEPNQ